MARPRQISDDQILTSTRACVLEHGARVSLDVVAESLGVTSPALLKRFGSREELMIHALRPPVDPPWISAMEAGPDDRPLQVQLTEHFLRMGAFFEDAVPCVAALRESGIPNEKFLDRKRGPERALRAIAAWLDAADKAGLAHTDSPESTATAILGALQMRAFTAHVVKVHFSSRSTREYVDDLAGLFARALTPVRRPAAQPRKHA